MRRILSTAFALLVAFLLADSTRADDAPDRALLRRLNRVEYNNTLRDLLGIELDLTETLPEDGTAHGFDNVDVALDLSATLFERYLTAADAALDAALTHGPRPSTVKLQFEPAVTARENKEKYNRVPYGEWNLIHDDRVVIRHDPPVAARMLVEPVVPAAGLYRYRIRAAAENDPAKRVSLRVYAGALRGGSGRNRMQGVYDLGDKPADITFIVKQEKGDTISLAASGITRQWTLPKTHTWPGAAVYRVDFDGPLIETWPPPSVNLLLGTIDPEKGTAADAEAVLRRFVPRAFRRPATEAELAPFLALAKSRLDAGYPFEAALRVALKAVLCSPAFLYLRSTPGRLNDFDLASRLSYFLWSTMPDDVLTALAARGELGKPDILHAQVERMLADRKAQAFTENFTDQWLDLRHLRMTEPDKNLYPEFDPLLEYSLPFETRLFFEEVLKGDRPLTEFVHAEWSMLNGRLADHYGIPGVTGQTFRPVVLPAACHRGGVLTMAAVLKVTANGTTSSPVVRGAWVLDRILGAPSRPPPENVPALEPDTRGSTTIRQQLAKHRADAGCSGCHSRIDPPGFALESFDPIGGWRTRYRVTGSKAYKPTRTFDGKGVAFADGPAVNAAGELADGRTFDNIDGFKKLLLADPDAFAWALAKRVVVYATGHGVEERDRAAIEKIVSATTAKNYGFRTLVHEIVRSDLFRNK